MSYGPAILELAQFLASGVSRGAIYAMVGIGFALIFRSSNVINFAQGEFVMVGGMGTVFLMSAGLPLQLAAIGAVAIAAVIGLTLQHGVIAKAKNASVLSVIIITIGAGIFMRGMAEVVVGRDFYSYPSFSGEAPVGILGAKMSSQSLWIIGTLIAIVIGTMLFLSRTKFGKAIEAVACNKLAAEVIGIDIGKVLIVCFALAAALGAIGGVVMTPVTLTHFEIGVPLALKGFCAAIVGGLSSPFGAILGGLVLGVTEALTGGYVSTTYQELMAFVLILVTLTFRPEGLIGRKIVVRV